MRRSSFSRSPSPEVRNTLEPLKKEYNTEINSLVEKDHENKNLKIEIKKCKALSVENPESAPSRDKPKFEDEIKQEIQKEDNIAGSNVDFEEIDDIFASDTEQVISKDGKLLGNPSYNKRLECDDDDGYYLSYIGEIIGNRYKVSSNSTGKGMFSTVVKCVDMETQNEVAIKIIRINDMMRSTGEKEYSFFKKFRGAPNIVQVQGSFIHQNHLCIVFEWLHGSLKNCIHNISKHNIRKTQDLAFQILQGLKLVHEKGLVHADLKPENILIDSGRKTIRISDFGSMHYTSDASPACYLVSRFYRAPEIILGCISYGQPIDVWSIGCVLYECFTGDILFKGRTNNDMIKLIMEYRGNFPKRLLNQGVFTKNHFSECFTQFKWINLQGMLQIIKNHTQSKNIYNDMIDSVNSSEIVYSETEQTLIRRLSNLIERCLIIDPKKRISAKEALEHPFFQLK
ncbi:uncharacterized protein cubi_03744 [Cryptosporidium ubiquitum]|uniref:Protein kinase domain-containing protein n=1 Tax=Cryptosporidium ubiquitum TaxID=857276 RepID=A0A1J4MLZ1_9CRYT|nr:uncharacterized protein cubi_03744 [Cryptosporidium ubiquitum]OII75265.1 hypothetical protein cubi_03744 [Cryptosporidium ubiquitum]